MLVSNSSSISVLFVCMCSKFSVRQTLRAVEERWKMNKTKDSTVEWFLYWQKTKQDTVGPRLTGLSIIRTSRRWSVLSKFTSDFVGLKKKNIKTFFLRSCRTEAQIDANFNGFQNPLYVLTQLRKFELFFMLGIMLEHRRLLVLIREIHHCAICFHSKQIHSLAILIYDPPLSGFWIIRMASSSVPSG